MANYKIVYKQKSCIGAAECEAVSPELWKMQPTGKAALAQAMLNPKTGNYELIIDEKQLPKQKAVAGSCPAGCISIEPC